MPGLNLLDELVRLRGAAESAYASVGDWEHHESGEQFLRAIERANKAINAARESDSVGDTKEKK